MATVYGLPLGLPFFILSASATVRNSSRSDVTVSPFDCYATVVALDEDLWRMWIAVRKLARYRNTWRDHLGATLHGPRD